MIQQGKYADYPAIGIFGASPLLIANTREQPEWEPLSAAERRAWITARERPAVRRSGIARCTTARPREQYRGIFHVIDVPDDLLAYDEAECHTLIPRNAGIDGMTPGSPNRSPIGSGRRSSWRSASSTSRPIRTPSPRAIRVRPTSPWSWCPRMAHMHNFAETRAQLWQRFFEWLPVTRV